MKVFLLDKELNNEKSNEFYLSKALIDSNKAVKYVSINNPSDSNKIYIISSLGIVCDNGTENATIAICDENIGENLKLSEKEINFGYGTKKPKVNHKELIVYNVEATEKEIIKFLNDKNIMILPGGSVIINFAQNVKVLEVNLNVKKEVIK